MDKCALCGNHGELQKSHIIPKFATDWLKKSSATGFLRQAITPEKRVQDGGTEKLLCKSCEERLSKYENYFAKNVFYPFVNKGK